MGQFHFDPASYRAMVLAEVPDYEEFQDAVGVACVPGQGAVARILELGTGTGETARRVLARHPGATLVGVDESEGMLQGARRLLGPERVTLVVGRIQDDLPDGPFDVVCSALAVHHLNAGEKQALFRRVHDALRPGGRFVLGDVVLPEDGPEDGPEDAPEGGTEGGTESGARRTPVDDTHDKPDSAADQLRWLEDAGLHAHVVWQRADLVVLVADRPPSG